MKVEPSALTELNWVLHVENIGQCFVWHVEMYQSTPKPGFSFFVTDVRSFIT